MQTQDAIVAHLAHAIDVQLIYAEGARLKRTPATNRDAEDLALQCDAGHWKAGFVGKEADAAYALCEQALAIDPDNVRALVVLGVKPWAQAAVGLSGDARPLGMPSIRVVYVVEPDCVIIHGAIFEESSHMHAGRA